jgi:hypothetical protein
LSIEQENIMLFADSGFRPLWPVIFFLPWFFIGIACLLAPALQRRSTTATIQRAHRKAASPLIAAWHRHHATGRLGMRWQARGRRKADS